MDQYRREEYISRINRVIDYIESHIDEELTLEKLARVANFSRYHFHRIFTAFVREPLYQFIQRIRLERAASSLLSNPKSTITEITYKCGFSNSASFSRAFKDHFSMSATEWRSEHLEKSNTGKQESKNCKTESNIDKDGVHPFAYSNDIKLQNRRSTMTQSQKLNVEVKEFPEMDVAYIRYIGPYKGDSALFENLFNRLFSWAGPRNLLNFPETKIISVYHDDPNITEEAKLRTSVCLTVPKETKVDGEVGKMTIEGGKYAAGHFELKEDEYEKAWTSMYSDWLPESGYQPSDGPAFELYHNNPEEHPEKKCIVDICIPVKPL